MKKKYKTPELYVHGNVEIITKNSAVVGPGDGGYARSAPPG